MEKYAKHSVKPIYVVNADSEDYTDYVPDGGWLNYWRERCRYGDASFCRKCGSRSNIIGGHVEPCTQKDDGVWYSRIDIIYIVPLCSKCNNYNDPDYKKLFQVKKDDLIAVPEETIKYLLQKYVLSVTNM